MDEEEHKNESLCRTCECRNQPTRFVTHVRCLDIVVAQIGGQLAKSTPRSIANYMTSPATHIMMIDSP